jgi:hypothetical protein
MMPARLGAVLYVAAFMLAVTARADVPSAKEGLLAFTGTSVTCARVMKAFRANQN